MRIPETCSLRFEAELGLWLLNKIYAPLCEYIGYKLTSDIGEHLTVNLNDSRGQKHMPLTDLAIKVRDQFNELD